MNIDQNSSRFQQPEEWFRRILPTQPIRSSETKVNTSTDSPCPQGFTVWSRRANLLSYTSVRNDGLSAARALGRPDRQVRCTSFSMDHKAIGPPKTRMGIIHANGSKYDSRPLAVYTRFGQGPCFLPCGINRPRMCEPSPRALVNIDPDRLRSRLFESRLPSQPGKRASGPNFRRSVANETGNTANPFENIWTADARPPMQ